MSESRRSFEIKGNTAAREELRGFVASIGQTPVDDDRGHVKGRTTRDQQLHQIVLHAGEFRVNR